MSQVPASRGLLGEIGEHGVLAEAVSTEVEVASSRREPTCDVPESQSTSLPRSIGAPLWSWNAPTSLSPSTLDYRRQGLSH